MTRHAYVLPFLLCSALALPAVGQTSPDLRGLILKGAPKVAQTLSLETERPAPKRYAFVIGNGAYQKVPSLKNPIADAQLVAEYMRESGYIVNEFYDLDKAGFEQAIQKVLFEVSRDTEVVFYFAGHGIQIGQKNFLIPTDADMDEIFDVPFETVSLSSIMKILGARARSVVAILDSCRDNPFEGRQGLVELSDLPADLRAGFSAENTPINSLLVFSTSPGAVASDGIGANSPFTASFVEMATAYGDQPVDDVLKRVRKLVYERTEGAQIPWESSSLIEPVIFRENATLLAQIPPAPIPQPVIEAAPVAVRSGEPLIITAALDQKIAIGGPLEDLFQARSARTVQVAAQPQFGRLEVLSQGRFRGIKPVALDPLALPQFVYHAATGQIPASQLDGAAIEDAFSLDFDGTIEDVQLRLEIDDCDFQAGDLLDPEGVGVTRYPNEIVPQEALRACQVAVADNPEAGRFHYQLGRAQFALRDFTAAEASFTRARDLGHTRAWYGLGTIEVARVQATGGRSGRASDQALAYFAVGADRGDPYAIHSLGRQLLLFGDPAEQEQGFELLSRSLELGHTFSMNALGLYFLDDDAPNYNPARGLRYLQESAERGDIYGYANMGFVALTGAGGTQKDLTAAETWFLKAANQGHPTAPTSLGRMHARGQIGGAKNVVKAVEFYDLGLNRGHARGGVNAAKLIANGEVPGLGMQEAVVRAAKAAALRDPRAGADARDVLTTLYGIDPRAVDAAAQALMVELGESLTVDGAFGAGSAAALDRVAAREGVNIPNGRVDRAVALAKLVWKNSKFRVDLY